MSDSEAELLIHDSDEWSPCDDCDLNYINKCSSCQFASPSINDSLNYLGDCD